MIKLRFRRVLNDSVKVTWPEGAAASDGKTVQNPDESVISDAPARFG